MDTVVIKLSYLTVCCDSTCEKNKTCAHYQGIVELNPNRKSRFVPTLATRDDDGRVCHNCYIKSKK